MELAAKLKACCYLWVITSLNDSFCFCFWNSLTHKTNCLQMFPHFFPQYFVFVFLIFVVMLVGSILGYVFREKVVQTIRQEMYSSLPYYGNRRAITLAWDETQTRLKCCGIESYRDWYGSIPESCCQETYGGQRKPCIDAPSPLTLHINGCRNVTTEFVRQHASVMAGAGITVAVLLVFAQIFSLILFKTIEWAENGFHHRYNCMRKKEYDS